MPLSRYPMDDPHSLLRRTDAPVERPIETLDVRDLGPPKPLTETLETLVDLPDETVLLQLNDRAPQFLYPKLKERGYHFETVAGNDETITAIWKPIDSS